MQGKRNAYKLEEILTANRVQCEALLRSPEYKEFFSRAKKTWGKCQDRLKTEALGRFGISYALLLCQGIDFFFSPDDKWPEDIICFPEYFEYSNIGLSKVMRVEKVSNLDALMQDHILFAVNYTEPFDKDQVINQFKILLDDLLKEKAPSNYNFFKVGSNRIHSGKDKMRKAPFLMLRNFEYFDYYEKMNMNKHDKGQSREGYGRVAKAFNVSSAAARNGIERAREAITDAGQGCLLYPILDGKRNPVVWPDWQAELEGIKKKPQLNKLTARKKRIDAFNKNLKKKRVIKGKKYPSIEEEEKQFKDFLDSLKLKK